QEHAWPVEMKCNANGPGLLVTHEILPWLSKTVYELEELSTRLVDGLNEGIAKLEPHLDRSPMYKLDRQEYFDNMKNNLDKYYSEVYDDVVSSWVNFTIAYERYEMRIGRLMNPYSCTFAMKYVGGFHPYQNVFLDLHYMAQKVEESYYKASGILKGVLRELAITTRAMVTTCVVMLTETLNLTSLDKEDYDRLILNNIEKLAPNFLGSLMRKFVNKEGSGMKLINANVLGELEDVHQALQYQLAELHEQCYDCTLMYKMYEMLWNSQAYASRQRTRKRPKFSQEVTKIYQNEAMLSEIVMSLMATFNDD
ncbi:hypothetical protein FHG87_020233, partial [Trinorchestia longiramus]